MLVLEHDLDVEEGAGIVSDSFGAADPVLHCVEGVLGGLQEALVEVPEIVFLDF
jgi:hypothetical protein